MLQAMLDHCLYPRPTGVFSSDQHRNAGHGFQNDAHVVSTNDISSPLFLRMPPDDVTHECARIVAALFKTRDIAQSGQAFLSLDTSGRRQLMSCLISAAMSSGDESDAALIASFLCHPSVHGATQTSDAQKAFEGEVAKLEDTVLDVPSAYRIMATLLHASALPIPLVEDLASRIIVNDNPARDRLLEEVQLCLGISEEPLDQTSDHDTSGEECSTSEYAYAY